MDYSSPSQSPRLLHFRYAPTAGDHFHELEGKEEMAEGFNYGQNSFASHNSLNGEDQTVAKRHASLSSPLGFSPESDDPRLFGGFYSPYAEGNTKRNQYSSIGKLFSYSQENQQNGEFIEGGVNSEGTFHYQDAVCKVRAKRGCATHPRSIAERVRRTRISERMRKLQELVPSLDKQTNTADMLDYAVDYIKDLQRQLETLSENRANCKCMPKQNPAQYHVRL